MMAGINDLKKIQHKGIDVTVSDGFHVYHGFKNIQLGNHIRLVNTLINAGDNNGQVIIDDYVFCGHNVMILARDHDYNYFGSKRQSTIREKNIHIETGAWLCSGSIILGGVTVGKHAVVSAGSVVKHDVPAYAIVAGNPAVVVKLIPRESNNRFEQHINNPNFTPVLRFSNNIKSTLTRGIQSERISAVLKYSNRSSRILDIGSGVGAYTDYLLKRGNSVVGVDTVRYEEWKGFETGSFVNASGKFLPFQDKSFDISIAFEVLEHIPWPQQTLQEIRRCTQDKVILSVPNCDLDTQLRKYNLALAHWTDPTHCNFFTKDTIENLLIDNGYDVLEILDAFKIDPNNYFWDSVRLPKRFTNIAKSLFAKFNLTETFWSSVLVVAKVK